MSHRVFLRSDAQKLRSGRLINPLDLSVDDINFEVMFWVLSGINRFNGAIEDHWSVAHHLALCDRIARHLDYTPEARLHLIVHDLHESMLGDVATPVKELFGRFTIEQAERAVDKVIYEAIGINGFDAPIGEAKRAVKLVDSMSLTNEAAYFGIDLGYVGDTRFTLEVKDIQRTVGDTNYKETRANLRDHLIDLFGDLSRQVITRNAGELMQDQYDQEPVYSNRRSNSLF